MKIQTAYFGPQEVNPESVLSFPRGLPGFEEVRQFQLFHEDGKPTIFWLQSVEDPELTFSVAPPELFNFAYELVLTDEEVELLGLEQPEDAVVLLMLSKSEGDEVQDATGNRIRANLRGPLIINPKRRVGFQKVLPRLTQTTLLRAD